MKPMALTLHNILRPRSAVRVQDMEKELLVTSGNGSEVHVLNWSARAIFLRLDGSLSLGKISGDLASQYHRDVEKDVLEVATRLYRLGILEQADMPPS